MINLKKDEMHVSQRVREENVFVKCLINLISPRYFFDEDTREKISTTKHKAFGKIHKREKQQISAKKVNPLTKHKRAKLVPELHQSVTKIQEGLYHPDQVITSLSDKTKFFNRHEDLQHRLKQKLDKLRSDRKTDNKRLGKKRLKHRLSNANGNLKNRCKMEKLNSVKENNTEIVKKEKNNLTEKNKKFNSNGHTVFSKFDFPEAGAKNKNSKLSGKDYKSLLNKIEKESSELNELMIANPEKGASLKEKSLWMKALHKAEGIKLKDDAVLLKRSLQKKEQIKAQKKKKWAEREKNVKEKMEARQKKRRDNILAKKKEKVKKKIQRAIKKGRLIPGFN